MISPIVSLYAALPAGMATLTPPPVATTHRPSPNPFGPRLSPARGFHFHHGGGFGGYGPDGQDGSGGLLITVIVVAVVVALAAWLFLFWRGRHPRTTITMPAPAHPEAPGWDH